MPLLPCNLFTCVVLRTAALPVLVPSRHSGRSSSQSGVLSASSGFRTPRASASSFKLSGTYCRRLSWSVLLLLLSSTCSSIFRASHSTSSFHSTRCILQTVSIQVYIGFGGLGQCFPTAGLRPGTGPWHQLYRAARGKYFIVEIF
jgi:hypothetical protein